MLPKSLRCKNSSTAKRSFEKYTIYAKKDIKTEKSNNNKIDISNLKKGIYLLKVNLSKIFKVMKE